MISVTPFLLCCCSFCFGFRSPYFEVYQCSAHEDVAAPSLLSWLRRDRFCPTYSDPTKYSMHFKIAGRLDPLGSLRRRRLLPLEPPRGRTSHGILRLSGGACDYRQRRQRQRVRG